jgi:hypothetical protein
VGKAELQASVTKALEKAMADEGLVSLVRVPAGVLAGVLAGYSRGYSRGTREARLSGTDIRKQF